MIPLFKPYMPPGIIGDAELLLYSGKLAFGANGRLFETALNEYLGTANAVTVNSFGSAMELLLNIYGIGPGTEVIMSPIGCLRSSQPVACCGAKVIWADIDPATGTLSPESVKQKITPQTGLILNYHHLGYVGYTDELNAIGAAYGIPVVEDCLDGIGALYKGRKVGTCGDAAVISFDAVRLPNAVEGGALVFRSSAFSEKARLKRDLGVDRKHYRDENNEIYPGCDISMTGYACTLNDLNSLIALRQMPELDQLLERRRRNAHWWKARLADRRDCTILREVAESRPNYWVFGLLTDRKMPLLKEFREQGYCASGIHFPNNHYSVFRNPEALPGVEEFQRRFLALPAPAWCEL